MDLRAGNRLYRDLLSVFLPEEEEGELTKTTSFFLDVISFSSTHPLSVCPTEANVLLVEEEKNYTRVFVHTFMTSISDKRNEVQ